MRLEFNWLIIVMVFQRKVVFKSCVFDGVLKNVMECKYVAG